MYTQMDGESTVRIMCPPLQLDPEKLPPRGHRSGGGNRILEPGVEYLDSGLSRHTSVAARSGPRVSRRTPLRQATVGCHVRRGPQHLSDPVAISVLLGTRRTSDEGGGIPLSPAETLRKRHARTGATPTVATPATTHMVIVHPLSEGRFTSRGNSHPPAEAHVGRLETMVYGGDTRSAARTLGAPIMLDYQRRGGRVNPITPGVTPRDAGRIAGTMQQRPGS
jgi:hypothetical protein